MMIQIAIPSTPSNSKIQEKHTVDYKVINYDQGFVCHDDHETGKYRSVIVSAKTNRVVAYGPKKSVSLETFKERYPEVKDQLPADVYICENIEGTMINLFFDKDRNVWEIATKGAVGGHYWYYRQYWENRGVVQPEQYTFRQMFMEAVGESALGDLNESYLVQDLDKNMSYSFVLQHPANHLVLDIVAPAAYLVAIFEITHDDVENSVRHVPLFDYYNENAALIDKRQYGVFDLPWVFRSSVRSCELSPITVSYADVEQRTMMHYFPVGYMMIHSITGDRVTFKSERYERLKAIRGNHPNLQYQYLAIMRTGKIGEFLGYFPMYSKLYHQFYEQMSDYVKSVHRLYLDIYVNKKRAILENLDKTTRYHLHQLHYHKHLLDGEVVTRTVIYNWLLYTLEPGQLLYLLRTNIRV